MKKVQVTLKQKLFFLLTRHNNGNTLKNMIKEKNKKTNKIHVQNLFNGYKT